jgi:arylsulfatase A-like enzyme
MKVLILTVRGLRAGALGCYGNPWIDTPALDTLAAQGIVFDRHLADHADAAGARRAWRSGRYHLPAPPGQGLPEPVTRADLIATLRDQGVFTSLILDASRPFPADFTEGWDTVETIGPEQHGESALEEILERTRVRLESLQEHMSWLLWLDLGTTLPPWDVPEEFQAPYFQEEVEEEDQEGEEEEDQEGEEEAQEPLLPLPDPVPGPIDPADDTLYLRLGSSYAAAVSYLDAAVGQLLEDLSACEGAEEIVVLFTSDVGLPLGEHGIVGPVRPWLHDELIHVPLLLRLPGAAQAGRRVAALTQAVDLAPTLAELFGVALPDVHGHSLLPLATGRVERLRDYACSGAEGGDEVEWALRTPEWTFLLPFAADTERPRSPRLYVQPDDLWQVNDVVQHHLDLADRLEQTLRDFVAATHQPGPLQIPPLPDLEAEAKGETDEPASAAESP